MNENKLKRLEKLAEAIAVEKNKDKIEVMRIMRVLSRVDETVLRLLADDSKETPLQDALAGIVMAGLVPERTDGQYNSLADIYDYLYLYSMPHIQCWRIILGEHLSKTPCQSG